ncbi:MAG: ELWxxDGT repeat protein, partial [Halofilum sp. (in: g-proteobacteria)]
SSLPLPAVLAGFEGELYFQADDSTSGIELWKTDGSEAGTGQVIDLNTGVTSSSNPRDLTVLEGTLYFAATDGDGAELWRTDGTETGTTEVRDIDPGVGGSAISEIVVMNDALFFNADDGATGDELWTSDGTEAGTVRVADINTSGDSNPRDLFVFR